ncbi:hypothetical protein TcasGA2_TC032602 [Tribolium castaneum]|uniref:Platelet-derived growth factor (PDGF) family profile domain-containing protein n=1 Tax=Tribolium castaneum TaxID=7070 RepID=A0A139WKE0_TRICA|nr:PREDICTED: uncharacterized protein LOC103313147 [Tribolium castaneum]KYB28402.1 hypothetical protein TcasGA2_TC032602 [Tribolium castaneum]|eukprot:XP_008193871.1 PREDICTED: uncharacterized protein LOC103313147 [Tribolium castaneum]
MCYVLLRQLVLLTVIFAVKGTSLQRFVDLIHTPTCVACKIPQPRAVVLAQEVQIAEDTAPYMAIFHRCDGGSGCCSKGKVCKAAKEEILNATILVKIKREYYKPFFFEIRNHTSCSCQNIADTPK